MESIFFEISLILIVGTVCAAVAKLLRQPMIPAYILAGVLLGPPVLHVIERGEFLETLSTFGIAFLLFLVGIELDLRKLLKSGKVAILLGVVQMAASIGIGFFIIRMLGFDSAAAFFLATALGFSSTIVVMKLLSERKELDTLFGQIVIGIMLTQDFIAVLFLIFFNVFTGDTSGSALVSEIGLTVVKGLLLFALAFITSKYLLVHVFKFFARSTELLFLGSICWCLIFVILSIFLGFSIEVGALLAGVSLSFLPYSIEIAHRVKSLRDFFLPIFFAILGGQLMFGGGSNIAVPTVLLSILVLIVSPIVVIGVLLLLRYRTRTSFMAGISIGQVSEFSFILVSAGFTAGIISEDIVSLVALIGLVTMTLSAYMIEYGEPLYAIFRPLLRKFERDSSGIGSESLPKGLQNHVILFGHHTMGYKAEQIIRALKKPLVIVDYNPDVIEKLGESDIPHLYGSMNDEEVVEKAGIASAEYVVSTVHNPRVILEFLDYVKKNKIDTQVIVTAYDIDDALEFYEHGASFVIYPTLIGADYLINILKGSIKRKRSTHIKELEKLRTVQYGTV
ncbi:MAG: cation:proton antiporter [Candidatus Kerfeldbacteria bacterium]